MSKILFITGAERQIGRAIAIHAAEEGHTLILQSYIEDKLQELCKMLDKLDAVYISSTFDLDDYEAYSRVIEIACKKFGKIDALINSERVAYSAPLNEMTIEDFDKMWKVNVKGVFNGIHLTIPKMKKQEDGGDIVNIISTAGKTGVPNWSGYSATMFAVRGFTQSIAKEVAASNIRVMNLFPGFIMQDKNGTEMAMDQDKLLKPEDIAQSVLNAITMHKRALISEMVIYPSNFS